MSSPGDAVRDAADAPVTADVVVVGGGLVGASVAYELAGAGVGVALVDAPLPGRASDAGAGIVSPETFHDADEQWYGFGARAAEHLRALPARLAEDGVALGADAFAPCGSLVVALAEHENPWFEEVLQLAENRSSVVGEVAPDEARMLFPPLGQVWRALHSPTAWRVDGRGLRAAVRAGAARRGAALVEMQVRAVDVRRGRVTAVHGDGATVSCGALVLAGGAWSGEVGRWLGAELPVSPTKGQIVHVVLPGADGAGAVHDSGGWPIVQPVANFYLVPWPGGRVACGGTFEAAAGFDVRPTAGGLRDLLRECVAIAPGLAGATFHEVRVGLRPTSADDRPLLGPLPGTDNVHLCTGHGANGLLMGPWSGAVVAAGIAAGVPDPPPYPAARLLVAD